MGTTEIVLTEEPIAQPEAKESNVVKSVKKKKVRREFSSRGRMPDEEVKIALVKKEAKKWEEWS